MKLCNSGLPRWTASRKARMPVEDTPCASGVLRRSLTAPAVRGFVRQAGKKERRPTPAVLIPTCLRNALRFDVMPTGFRHQDQKDKHKPHVSRFADERTSI